MAVRPEHAVAVMNLGNGYWFLRDYDQAITTYRRSIELRAGFSAGYTNLGIVLGQAGQHEAAVAAFERALVLMPPGGAAETYAEFAMVLSNRPETQLRDPRRAAELATKAVELEPDGGTGWTALGVALCRQGQWSRAYTALRKSIELGNTVSGGALRSSGNCAVVNRFFLAMSSWQLGQKDEARRWYLQAVDMEKDRQHTQDLVSFRAEAEDLLGLTARPASQPTTTPGAPE